jgi:hypothetical protein
MLSYRFSDVAGQSRGAGVGPLARTVPAANEPFLCKSRAAGLHAHQELAKSHSPYG